MKNENAGKVIKLFISIKDASGDTKVLEQDNLSLDKEGVLKDKFYAKELQRSVLLSSLESYTLAEKNGIDMPFGSLGENILMDFDVYKLNIGDRLRIGSALLEITKNFTLCKGLSKVDPKAPKLLKDHRGIFAKTVTDGTIQVGDSIYI